MNSGLSSKVLVLVAKRRHRANAPFVGSEMPHSIPGFYLCYIGSSHFL